MIDAVAKWLIRKAPGHWLPWIAMVYGMYLETREGRKARHGDSI